MEPTWTEDRTAALERLWGEGYSASLLAKRLGATRSAVLGKARRLNLPSRKSMVQAKRGRPKQPHGGGLKPHVFGKPKSLVPVPPTPPKAEAAPVGTKTFQQLGWRDCRWPFGDGPPYRFCGKPQQPGSSYCPQCRVRSVQLR